MANSENAISKNQTSDKNIYGESNIHGDEINLIDFFVVLWKHKYFILLATILPTLCFSIILFSSPRNYKVTYVYDVEDDIKSDIKSDISRWELNERNYSLLLSRFYSEENLNKIKNNLRKNGLEEYANQLNNLDEQSRKCIEFEVLPPFSELSKLIITRPEDFEKVRDMKASLLKATIIGRPEDDMYKVSSVIRYNIENIMPLYMIQQQLSVYIREYNDNLADIESGRFNLELALKNNNEILAGLKGVNVGVAESRQNSLVLQFDMATQGQYLPLDYQVQVVESKKIELEGKIKANEEKYKYYKDLLDLNNIIFVELGNKLSSEYSEEQFKAFLTGLIANYEKPMLKDCLNSYLKRVENRMMAGKPIMEKPKIYPIARGTVRKSGIVFVVSLMVSLLLAFLVEGVQKSQAQTF